MSNQKEMCVSEFKERFDSYANEIMCDGEGIASHNIRSVVSAHCPETDESFDIVDFEVFQLSGCDCLYGIKLVLKSKGDL